MLLVIENALNSQIQSLEEEIAAYESATQGGQGCS